MLYNLKIIILVFCLLNSVQLQAQPILSFFNELKSQELVELFSDPQVITQLQQLRAEVRMGMLDLTAERAGVIRQLNTAGIPVTAWLLLQEEQGYWFHLGNGRQAAARYTEVRDWAREHGLQFKYIGLDMELDMNDVRLAQSNPWKMVARLPGRLYDRKPLDRARTTYDSLLRMIQSDGFLSESYYAPFVKDDASLGNTALQQLTGFMDIRTNRAVPMLYSSFIGNPDGLLSVYGREAGVLTVAIGSTGGGIDPSLPTLRYEQLIHDLRLASSFATEVHIFSLEGCVNRGFLERLTREDLTPITTFDQNQIESTQNLQEIFRWSSRLLTYPTPTFLGLILIPVLLVAGIVWLSIRLVRYMRIGKKALPPHADA